VIGHVPGEFFNRFRRPWMGVAWAGSSGRLERDDFIAALFCSVKTTLAMGVPLAQLIFGAKGHLGLILLPIIFYHPFQLFVCGLLANHFSNQQREIPVGEASPIGKPNRAVNSLDRLCGS
jgi:predicted Na+-dependent transporter